MRWLSLMLFVVRPITALAQARAASTAPSVHATRELRRARSLFSIKVRSIGVAMALAVLGCAERDVPIDRRAENIEAPAHEVIVQASSPSVPTPPPASCRAVSPADAFGRAREDVECGRERVAREGNCSVYDDGLTACYREGVVVRIRLRPCRLSSENALEDLRRAGFDVANADVEDTGEGTMVVGVQGVWIEGGGGYCYVNPHRG